MDITDKLFKYSMWWRIFYGTLRVILGLALLKVIGVLFTDIIYKMMSHEIIEDPSDLFFNIINSFFQSHPFSITYFLSAYLIFWGIIDIVLSINLLRHKIWAFSISLYFIGFFNEFFD